MAPLTMLPTAALGVMKEVLRHLLRRPVIGIAAAARTEDDRWLLIRRADTGTWCLPGGTLEWGETLTKGLARELAEEAGVDDFTLERVSGIYSRPDRDPRFHAVTIVVVARIKEPTRAPMNPLEIREAKLFKDDEIPKDLAMGMNDMFRDAREGKTTVLE